MDYYITKPIKPPTKQITLEDILKGEIEDLYKYSPRQNWTTTRTDNIVNQHFFSNVPSIKPVEDWLAKYANMIHDDMSPYYREFKIPKAKGGYRTIDDPNAQLREAQSDLKKILEDYGASYHTAAFAYIKGRCAKDAVVKHQLNKSNWCLRTDFSNFFGSITHEFLCNMIFKQYPFCAFDPEDGDKLKQALKICFLHGGLPQGTIISPMLTNLMMIPIDYELSNMFWHSNFVYTRYADDIQISAYKKFNYLEVVSWIDNELAKFGAPFRIKPEKTKFSSVAGVNYMLGLNLNKEHKISVGHERKKVFKATLANLFCDYLAGKKRPAEEVQHINGVCSYYRSVEPEYIEYIIRHLENKFGVEYKKVIKTML